MGYYAKTALGIGLMLGALAVFAVSIIELVDIGTCASGGPYEISQPCPAGVEKWVGFIFGAVILFIAGIAVFALRGGRATEAGLPSPATEAGPDWGSLGSAGETKPSAPGPVPKSTLFANREAANARATQVVAPSEPATKAGDPVERLVKLDRLRAEGAISEAEFDAAKQRILREL